jgi:hypothetical protein
MSDRKPPKATKAPARSWPDNDEPRVQLDEVQAYRDDQASTLIPLSLSGRHLNILEVYRRHPRRAMTVQQVADLGDISRRESVGELMRELAEYGLLHLPHGERSGYALTTIARQILPELLAEQTQISSADPMPRRPRRRG